MDKSKTESELFPLFEVYPELQSSIRRIPLSKLPTPVQRLGKIAPNLWIKRDDLTSPIYGGNKVRKLEFLLADVGESKKVVTVGGIGTNHGLATAIFCRELGFSCVLLLFSQPVTEEVRRKLLLFHQFGAEMRFTGSMLGAGIHYYLWERFRNPGARFIYAGGSVPLGCLGFVNAVFELKEQIDCGQIPSPQVVFCPLGSSGTVAGLALGCALAGLNATVMAIRVSDARLGPVHLATPKSISKLINGTRRLMQRHVKHLPAVGGSAPVVVDDFFGGGYGVPSEKGERARRLLFERHGIQLDSTYTAKTFAAVLEHLQEPANQENTVLYWHTYSSVALTAKATGIQPDQLPQTFFRFFGEETNQGTDAGKAVQRHMPIVKGDQAPQ